MESLLDVTSCRVCIFSVTRVNEKEENCFCDPAERCVLMLSAPRSFSARPPLMVEFFLAVEPPERQN